MNITVGIDRALVMTIDEIRNWLVKVFDDNLSEEIEDLTFFIPWDIEKNIPMVAVHILGVSLDTVWIA